MPDQYVIQGSTLTAIANAIRLKAGSSGGMTPEEMPGEIASISTSGTQFIIGTPVEFELTGWDAALDGNTYDLECYGYKVGPNGLQVGLPDGGSVVNMLAVIGAALTIPNVNEYDPNPETGTPGRVAVTLSAVNAPGQGVDLSIALFGLEEAEPITVSDAAIEGIAPPQAGADPVRTIDNDQYTGNVEWAPEVSGSFAESTNYTATITLTAKPGYTFQGVPSNFFTVAGASSVSNEANSGIVTAAFPDSGVST